MGLQNSVSCMSIPPDDCEQALAPIFGPAVAFEVASQVGYIIGSGEGSIVMNVTAPELSVAAAEVLESRLRQAHSGR